MFLVHDTAVAQDDVFVPADDGAWAFNLYRSNDNTASHGEFLLGV